MVVGIPGSIVKFLGIYISHCHPSTSQNAPEVYDISRRDTFNHLTRWPGNSWGLGSDQNWRICLLAICCKERGWKSTQTGFIHSKDFRLFVLFFCGVFFLCPNDVGISKTRSYEQTILKINGSLCLIFRGVQNNPTLQK